MYKTKYLFYVWINRARDVRDLNVHTSMDFLFFSLLVPNNSRLIMYEKYNFYDWNFQSHVYVEKTRIHSPNLNRIWFYTLECLQHFKTNRNQIGSNLCGKDIFEGKKQKFVVLAICKSILPLVLRFF